MEIAQEVLDAAAADPNSPAWRKIWKDPSPDGWDLPAPSILPRLARTCAAFSGRDRVEVLTLAGVVALMADATSRRTYAQEIAALGALARQGMADEAIYDHTYVALAIRSPIRGAWLVRTAGNVFL